MNKLITFLLVLLILAGCVASPANTGNGTVARPITSEPPSLDPHGAAGAGQNVALPLIFDTLVYRDHDNEYKPFLAESWQIEDDGRVIIFNLREGIKFHDGTSLNAEAVRFSFERLIQTGQLSPLATGVAGIESIQVLDETTISFHFSSPSAIFFSTISTPYAGIVSPTAVQQLGEEFGQKPVGSGPFVLSEWEPGVAIKFIRNADYKWGPPAVNNQSAPHLESVVLKIMPDSSAQFNAYQAGELDFFFVNQPAQIERLLADSQTELHETVLNSLVYISFNCQSSPFDDVLVRKAVAAAINKDDLLNIALGGIGETAFAPLSPTLVGFSEDLKNFEVQYNLDQAAAYLKQAGYTQGDTGGWIRDGEVLQITLLISTRAPNEALATVIQNQLQQLGIPVTIKSLDSSAAVEAATNGDYQFMIWRYDWNDADVLNVYLSTSRIGRTNRTFYSNPALDEILNRAATTVDIDEREMLYFDAQKIILEDSPWVPLYVPKDYIAVNQQIDGIIIGPMGRVLLNDVEVNQ